jgi:hypothetical protein
MQFLKIRETTNNFVWIRGVKVDWRMRWRGYITRVDKNGNTCNILVG